MERLCFEILKIENLVNNVGLFEFNPCGSISDEDCWAYFEVNVLSGVRLAKRIVPEMLERGWRRIVFVNSGSAVNVAAEMNHYGASKAAMLAGGNGLAKLTTKERASP